MREYTKRTLLNAILAETQEILRAIVPKPRIVFRIGISEQTSPVIKTPQHVSTLRGEVITMLSLTDSQKCDLSVAFKDKKGQPAQVQGAPEWFVDNSEVLAISAAPDGLSCVVSAVGPLGAALISVKADADLGDGVTDVIGTLEVEVGAGPASTVEITPGTPSEQ